ncbi:hypothetical protein OAP14_02535 [Aliiglaciecola sp.]|nr:hypothetical protein [Aliiglaciecola sp.]
MNGRIYDPNLGRFLQADPHIQAPKNSQNYNRYSYVLNNPLSYTDPSGYFFKKLWQATTGNILRAIAKVPILNTAINVGLNFIPGCQVWCSAAFSAATTYAVTGSLKAAFTSGAITAATAYAFSQIGSHFDGLDGVNGGTYNFGGNMLTGGEVAQQIAAHAVVGGISSDLQGGKFGHGFFSAGVTKGIGGAFLPGGDNLTTGEIAQGTVVSAIIGGTASKISGGKFANGAQTGAFQFLFNQAGRALAERRARRGPIGPAAARSPEEQAAIFANLGITAGGVVICVATGCTGLPAYLMATATVLSADQILSITDGSSPVTFTLQELGISEGNAVIVRDSAVLALDVVYVPRRINAAFRSTSNVTPLTDKLSDFLAVGSSANSINSLSQSAGSN